MTTAHRHYQAGQEEVQRLRREMNIEQIEGFTDLLVEHRHWSEDRFGVMEERGPIGSLRHLSLEATEAAEEPTDIVEYADCAFLLYDALWRGGFTLDDLLVAMRGKMAVLYTRHYPKTPDGVPSQHTASQEG